MKTLQNLGNSVLGVDLSQAEVTLNDAFPVLRLQLFKVLTPHPQVLDSKINIKINRPICGS